MSGFVEFVSILFAVALIYGLGHCVGYAIARKGQNEKDEDAIRQTLLYHDVYVFFGIDVENKDGTMRDLLRLNHALLTVIRESKTYKESGR